MYPVFGALCGRNREPLAFTFETAGALNVPLYILPRTDTTYIVDTGHELLTFSPTTVASNHGNTLAIAYPEGRRSQVKQVRIYGEVDSIREVRLESGADSNGHYTNYGVQAADFSKLSRLETIRASGNNLTEETLYFPLAHDRLSRVYLSFNPIAEIALNYYENLQVLFAYGCGATNVRTGSTNPMAALGLDNNPITTFNSGAGTYRLFAANCGIDDNSYVPYGIRYGQNWTMNLSGNSFSAGYLVALIANCHAAYLSTAWPVNVNHVLDLRNNPGSATAQGDAATQGHIAALAAANCTVLL